MKGSTIKGLIDTGYPLTAKYIHAIYKLAHTLAAKYNVPQDYQDICQLALIAATGMESKFDDSKGSKFITFIKKPILQIVQKKYGYPKSSASLYYKISKFMLKYGQEHKVVPTTADIAKALNITEIHVKSIYFGKPYKISLNSLGDDFQIENEDTLLSNTIVDLLDSLTSPDKKLITEFYLEEYSIEELAVVYNTTSAKISKDVARILGLLREN